MKRIVASVGLVAVGVSGVYAAPPAFMGPDASKNWSVSATLRGFYDDNYTTASANELESVGFQVMPAIRYTLPLEQTYLDFGYKYSAKYFDDRSSDDPWDQAHQVDFQLNHTFSERYALGLTDSFVMANEPELMDGGVPYRTEGNNLRNQARVTFDAQMTRSLAWRFGYNNVLWDYENEWADSAPFASLSGLLDRVEHLAQADLRWQVQPETTALVGYNYGVTRYTGDEAISPGIMSEDRDNQSHYIYAGLNQNFLRSLSASIKLGATYIDYDNDQVNDDNWVPYADISSSFTYARGSYMQLGFVHTFNATDVIQPDAAGQVTSSQQSSTIYGLVHHQITPKLVGSLMGRFQDSAYQGGLYDSNSDQYFMAGVNLTYQINRHFSCEAGYNFDNLESDIPNRPYDRNRVYVGLTASY
jgi:hypothetical protein